MTLPTLAISVCCHNYLKRFGWFISSLMQQVDPPPFYIAASVSNESRAKSLEMLRDSDLPYDIFHWDHRMNRAVARTEHMNDSERDYDWILFTDCDMVFHPDYLQRLSDYLTDANKDVMLHAGRQSCDVAYGNTLADNYKFPIKDSFLRANPFCTIVKRNCGTGYSQIVHRDGPHDRQYPQPDPREGLATGIWLSPSDIAFRQLYTKRFALPNWFSENQVHLNHERDPDANTHLTTPR